MGWNTLAENHSLRVNKEWQGARRHDKMGRRKPFIDKKHATTYSLVCEEGPQVQQSGAHQWLDDPAPATLGLPLKSDDSGAGLPEDRRKLVLELGLPAE